MSSVSDQRIFSFAIGSYDLPIGDLNPDPNQPRKSMDPQALEELTASVKRVGIIQPLLFRVDAESANMIPVSYTHLTLPTNREV